MKREIIGKNVLKDAGVLLIVAIMVLSTAVIVTTSSIKNIEETESNDAEDDTPIKSIEGTESFFQMFNSRQLGTGIFKLGYYRMGDTLRACVSADGGIIWLFSEGTSSRDVIDAGKNCMSSQGDNCPDGMISYWKGDANADDYHGSNNGTYNGSGYVPGQVNQAFSFDGEDDYVEIPNDSSLNLGTGDFTLEAWITADNQTEILYPVILSNRGDDDFNGFYFGLSLWDQAVQGSLFLQIEGMNYIPCSTDLRGTGWHHVAVMRSGSSITFYVDGSQDGTANSSKNLDSDGNMLIGNDWAGWSPFNRTWSGGIDEVAVYNRALSVSEIRSHYIAGLDNRGYCEVEDEIYYEALGDADVTLIDDGYIISGSGEYGCLFTPLEPSQGVTCKINFMEIGPGEQRRITYLDKQNKPEHSVEVGRDRDVTLESNTGDMYPIYVVGTATGDTTMKGYNNGELVHESLIDSSDGFAGYLEFIKTKSFGVHPVSFNGTASGAPSSQFIVITIKDTFMCDVDFLWHRSGTEYTVDCLSVFNSNNTYTDIASFSVEAHCLDLSSTTMMNPGEFTVTHVRASDPPDIPDIDGPTSGKAGVEQSYTISAYDPNGDSVYYRVNWGDGTGSGWMGPYSNNEMKTFSHTWSAKGDYTVKVKAKDINGFESEWATLEVSMPRNKAYINTPFMQFLENFFERYPNAFPILRQILLQ